MNRRPIKTLRAGATALFVVVLLVYARYETKDIFRGPMISITSPEDGGRVTNEVIRITGTAKNISYLSLNGKPIYTDTAGEFSEQLLVPEGYTILELKAADRFNREAVEHIRIIRNEEASS